MSAIHQLYTIDKLTSMDPETYRERLAATWRSEDSSDSIESSWPYLYSMESIQSEMGGDFDYFVRQRMFSLMKKAGTGSDTSCHDALRLVQFQRDLDIWVGDPDIDKLERQERQEVKPRILDAYKTGCDLNLRKCQNLSCLPEGLELLGDLMLDECIKLKSLPKGLKIGGSLRMCGCTSLTNLTESLKIGGDLELSECVNLIGLPTNLKVSRNLILSNCSQLRELPIGLEVGNDLDLTDCIQLTSWPLKLRIWGDLCLNHCTGLTSLPSEILEWKAPYSHIMPRQRNVYTVGSGISLETIMNVKAEMESLRLKGENPSELIFFSTCFKMYSYTTIGELNYKYVHFRTLRPTETIFNSSICPETKKKIIICPITHQEIVEPIYIPTSTGVYAYEFQALCQHLDKNRFTKPKPLLPRLGFFAAWDVPYSEEELELNKEYLILNPMTNTTFDPEQCFRPPLISDHLNP